MTNKLVLQPPEIVKVDAPLVFLAGPIQGGPVWQPKAARMFHDQDPSIVIASPRRDYEADGVEFVYEKQVDWETHYLREASELGVVLFWLAKQEYDTPGRPYAQTSRFEIGEWKTRCELLGSKLVIGIEPGFTNERYIRRRFGQDVPGVPICDTLEDTVLAAIGLLTKTGIKI